MAQSFQNIVLKIAFVLAISVFVSAGKGFNADGEKDNGKRKSKIPQFEKFPNISINTKHSTDQQCM